MKWRAVKIVLIAIVLLSGCAEKQEILPVDYDSYYSHASVSFNVDPDSEINFSGKATNSIISTSLDLKQIQEDTAEKLLNLHFKNTINRSYKHDINITTAISRFRFGLVGKWLSSTRNVFYAFILNLTATDKSGNVIYKDGVLIKTYLRESGKKRKAEFVMPFLPVDVNKLTRLIRESTRREVHRVYKVKFREIAAIYDERTQIKESNE